MRVARLCCWLDCDSSLAGASLVILVCNDGSDLRDRKVTIRRLIRQQHAEGTCQTFTAFASSVCERAAVCQLTPKT